VPTETVQILVCQHARSLTSVIVGRT